MFRKKTTPNDGSGFCTLKHRPVKPIRTKIGSGFCPNVTFEEDEFKEDNKASNDQCFFVFLKLFIFNLSRLSFNFLNITSIGFVNIKKHVCRHQSKGYFYKMLQFTFLPNDIVTGQLSLIWE
jgi:hypothetical protein